MARVSAARVTVARVTAARVTVAQVAAVRVTAVWVTTAHAIRAMEEGIEFVQAQLAILIFVHRLHQPLSIFGRDVRRGHQLIHADLAAVICVELLEHGFDHLEIADIILPLLAEGL